MGWLPYIFNTNEPEKVDDTPLASAYYTNNLSWGDLEPRRGDFDWSRLDKLVAFSKKNGKKLRFSLNSVDPTTESLSYRPQIPVWFIQNYPNGGRWINSYYNNAINPQKVNPYNATPGYIYEPNYASEAYTTEYFRFLQALVTHWQSNADWKNTIEAFEISNYGMWGEWHSDYNWGTEANKSAVLKAFVNWYYALLPHTAGNYPSVRTEISTLFTLFGDSGVSHAVQYGADMTRKCIGICFNGFISSADYNAIMSYRQWRSFRGEFGSWLGPIENFYTSSTSTVPVNNTKGAIDEALVSFKANHLGWYVGSTLTKTIPGTNETYEDYFQKRAGYRFYLENISHPANVRPNDKVTVGHRWFQRGVAKIYQPTYLAVDLVGNGGVRYAIGQVALGAETWNLGPQGPYNLTSDYKIPANIPAGTYQVKFALVDNNRQPMINIAIPGKESADAQAYGFYSAGTIRVVTP